jgi:ABC-type amino acid transport system permease subunit
VTNRTGVNIGLRSLLLVIAIICFIVAALGVNLDRISVGWVGLAFFAGSFLVEDRRI